MPLPLGSRQVRGNRNLIILDTGEIVTRNEALNIGAQERGYSTNYQYRSEKRQAQRAQDKEKFWKPRAIKAINQIDWEYLYVDDGDPYRVRLSDRRWDDVPIDYNPITPERVLALGDRIGYEALTALIRAKIYMQSLYWAGQLNDATTEWLHRRMDLPDWFWWYHGVFA